MARDTALYHGHALAAVAAKTQAIAQEACRRIRVEYEPLEPVMDLDAALAPGATILHPYEEPEGLETSGPTNITSHVSYEGGNLEDGFAEAEVVVEHEFTTAMVHQGYIEPHGCTVRFNEDGK